MRILAILFFITASLSSFAQDTDASLSTQSTNEIRAKVYSPNRADDFNQDMIGGKMSRVERVTTSGTNTYTASGNAAITAYADGWVLFVKIGIQSTNSSTLNYNTIGAKKIFKTPTVQAGSGDLRLNQSYAFTYDASLDSGSGGFLIMGSPAVWGAITGSIGNQTDLQDSLSSKRALKTKLRTFTADHTLVAADAERIIFMDAATANTVTIPLDASVAYPLYTTIWLSQVDVGLTSVDVIPGVTIESSSGSFDSPGQNTIMMLYKWDTNSWKLYNGTVILPIDLTTDVTGVLPVANGGTGRNNNPADEILYGDGTSPIQSSSNFTFDGAAVTIGSPTDNIKIDQATGIISRAGTSKILQLLNPDGGIITVNENVTIQGNGVSITSTTSALELVSAANVIITPQTNISVGGTSSHSAELQLYEQTTSGSNYTAFKVAAQGSDITYTLPPSAPASNGYVLSSTTGGAWSWVAQSAGSSTFVGLSDGPGSYSGKTLNFIRVNAGETALEYQTSSQVKTDIGLGSVENTALSTWPGTANITTVGSSINLPGSPTTTTQSPGDNSTKIATTAFVSAAVTAGAGVVDGVTITGSGTSGSPWVASGLQPSANLSDVASAPTSRNNLRALADVNTYNSISTSYSIATTDFAYANSGSAVIILQSSASANNITINATTLSAVPVGSYFYFRRQGAGLSTFVPAGGASFTSTSGGLVDAGLEQLNVVEKTGSTTFEITNGGLPLGTANQLLGVNNAGTAQENKTVSNGLTSASGTLKLGGAFTADTQFSGAFSLGVGAAPTAKLSVTGLGTGTGALGLFEDNSGTDRWLIADNGKMTWVSAQSGAGILGFSGSASITSTANSQTMTGYDFNTTVAYGGFTGVTANLFRFRDTNAATDYWSVIQNTSGSTTSQIWNSTAIYDFKNSASTSIIRNSAAALSLRGGTASTTRMLQFQSVIASSTNNNATFNFTSNVHDYGTSVTRANTEILNDATITSVNGSDLTYTIFDNSPGFTLGTSTMILTGYNYKPTLTSGTFTHYAMRIQSGLSAFGQTNTPTAFMDLAASTTASASLRIRSGSAPSSPNDGEIWQDGTNYFVRSGSTTYTAAKTLTATATLNFPAAGASSSTDLTITVTGAADGDPVVVTPPNGSIVSNGIFTAWVSATNTVTVRFSNLNLVADPDPASGTFRAVVMKY